MSSDTRLTWSVVVLAGAVSRRVGGIDKALLELHGRTLLGRIVDAVPSEVPIIVAGPPRPDAGRADFVSEEPPEGGPLAGLIAALAHIATDRVAVVAVDMPWAADAAARAIALLGDRPGLVTVDPQGRRLLCPSAWRTDRLREVLSPFGAGRNLPMRAVLDGEEAHDIAEWSPAPADEHLLFDVDTVEDLAHAAHLEVGGAP